MIESSTRKEGTLWPELLHGCCVHPSSILLRTSCFEHLGSFDESITTGLDYDMWVRVAREYTFAAINEPLVKVRESGDRLTTNLELQIQGQSRFLAKWSKWIEADRESYCRCLVQLGILYSLTGQQDEGRKAFWKALKRDPFYVKPYALLFLSFWGTNMFRKITEINAAVRQRWLRGEVSSGQ
jgi:hypothetical protein